MHLAHTSSLGDARDAPSHVEGQNVQIVSCAAGAESAHFCIRGESL